MPADNTFPLPSSGLDIIEKIIRAYFVTGTKEFTLEEIISRSGVNLDSLTRNHPFLVALGIVTGVYKKAITESGAILAAALQQNLEEEAAKSWRDIILNSQPIEPIISMIKVQSPFSEDELKKRIALTLRKADGPRTRSGVSCLVQIMKKAKLLTEDNGNISWNNEWTNTAKTLDSMMAAAEQPIKNSQKLEVSDVKEKERGQKNYAPALHIDIQIHIAADASSDQIDQIFSSMAKHLYQRLN